MVVNSIRFLLFFVIVFTAYYALQRRSAKWQNLLLFIASYVFYGIADIKMIPLLFGSSLLFYFLGHLVERCNDSNPRAASLWTTVGTVVGIGVLFYFKYLGFFVAEFSALLGVMGIGSGKVVLSILMPLGISFFTFRLISYPIEIHRRHISASHDFVAFGTYIAFFPTILSGPIDCPKFIDQFRNTRIFNYEMATDGCRQILWGMFTKMVIADNLAKITDVVWADYNHQNASTLLIVAFLYLIQMYADFDGYSNMAIGVGKILGFGITRNFNHPFLSRNVAEYWRRWHISLTSWLTDYVFMPLSVRFRDWGKWGLMVAIVSNMLFVGLWHGANWTFALFGLYHGLLFIPLVFNGSFGKNKKLQATSKGMPKIGDSLHMLLTFCLVSFGLIIFRANSINDAFGFIAGMIDTSIVSVPNFGIQSYEMLILIISIALLFCTEWFQRDKEYALQFKTFGRTRMIWLPYIIDYYVVIAIFIAEDFGDNQFIYFQF